MRISKSRRTSQVSCNVSILPILCLIVALAVVLGAGSGCGRITKGPVLLRVYEDRAALMWESNRKGPGKVSYKGSNQRAKHIVTKPELVQYNDKKGSKKFVKKTAFIHKVWLENLQRGQVYNYRVSVPNRRSKVYKFRTSTANTNEIRFAVYGDSRNDTEIHRKLVEIMIDKKVDFVVHSGDLVNSGNHYEQWGPQFFKPIEDLAENVPIYIAKGNHEGNRGIYEKLLIPVGEKNSFGFDYGPVHYFCADNVSRGLKTEEVLKLIAADAASSKAQWKFVSYHVPSLNFGGHWSAWGYPDALPILAKVGVDFVVVGHSHQYERFWPIAPPGETSESYVTYITSGGGGGPLHDVNVSDYHACAQKINHVCIFDIQGNKLSMETIGIDGRIIDHLEITKANGSLNKEYIDKAIPMERVSAYQAANLHKKH